MAIGPDFRTYRGASSATSAAVLDAGLRAYMLRVYNWMASGLVLTGLVAFVISHTQAIDYLYPTVQNAQGFLVHRPSALAYLLIFAPLVFVMVLSFGVNRLSRTAAQTLFWVFAAVMGASLTNIFLIYTQTSIVTVFFICAATFAATSAWGYVTKRDLTGMGSFMMMGLFGIIIAMVVNMFVRSSELQFGISIVGVLVFTGLTAYDTQRIKADYIQNGYGLDGELSAKRSVYDALALYLNFINLFLMLLQIMGNRNNN